MLVALWLAACASPELHAQALSGVDSRFRLERLQTASTELASVEVSFYRQVLSKTLFSSCQWFPSDSEYVRLKSLKCTFARGFFGGFARFLNEPDAANMDFPVILQKQGSVFVDLPGDCEQI